MNSGVWNFGFVVIVGEKFATLIHRFEKFNRALQPGVNFKIPFIDKIAYVHDLREQVVEISSQVAVTQDNVALHIDGVLFVEVIDPHAASYQVEDFQSAITNLAQTTMRSEIGKLTLDKMFVERSTLNQNIVLAIEQEAKEWGLKALRYEIKDIEPPNNIQKSMILQAEAERRKRASILTSEGDRIANINVAEAEKMSEMLKAQGLAEGQILQAKAQALALSAIEAEMSTISGNKAAQFLLAQQQIEAYRKLARPETTVIVTKEVAEVKDLIEDTMNVLPLKIQH